MAAYDNVIEMKAPSTQQRYEVIKNEICAENLKSKEVLLQKMAHMTEYFLAKDLFHVW